MFTITLTKFASQKTCRCTECKENNIPVNPDIVSQALAKNPPKERGNEEIIIELTPDYVDTYYLGVNLKQAESKFINYIIYGGIETKEFAFSIIDNIKMIFTGGVNVDQMMGPVGISEVVAKTNGFREFVYMLALISLSLGVTNLLPIPALDGGKILILIIEAIRRKPLNEKTEINIQLIGFSILIALSIIALILE